MHASAILDKVSIPGGKPLHEPLALDMHITSYSSWFQSLAGSPSTSHLSAYSCTKSDIIVSIPGGKPLHEPLKWCVYGLSYISAVSIPGGKPLHEPLKRPVAPTKSLEFQSLAGSPSTSHNAERGILARATGFNPWREAPPRATPERHCVGDGNRRRFNPWREAPPRATQN